MTISSARARAHGLLLAAGAGTRMGGPKALLTRPDGMTYVERAARTLLEAGCPEVVVVLGAAAEEAAARLEEAALPGVRHVICPTWSDGQGESLRCGLRELADQSEASLAVIHLVDLPDVGPAAIRRVLAAAGTTPTTIARAAYQGVGGHPVLLGRDHWAGAALTAAGDQGARSYLREHSVRLIEVGEEASGRDVDTPADLRRAGAQGESAGGIAGE